LIESKGFLEEKHEGPVSEVLVLRKPWGPAVCITPWNAPAPLEAHKIACALAVGCPVILKPSEWAHASSQLIAQVLSFPFLSFPFPSFPFCFSVV